MAVSTCAASKRSMRSALRNSFSTREFFPFLCPVSAPFAILSAAIDYAVVARSALMRRPAMFLSALWQRITGCLQPAVWNIVVGEKHWWFEGCEMFLSLDAGGRRRLERHAVLRTFHCGETITAPDRPEPSALVVLDGQVAIKVRNGDDGATVLG